MIYNPLGEIEIEEGAFNQLVQNYFRAIKSLAELNKDPILNTQWGKSFLHYLNR